MDTIRCVYPKGCEYCTLFRVAPVKKYLIYRFSKELNKNCTKIYFLRVKKKVNKIVFIPSDDEQWNVSGRILHHVIFLYKYNDKAFAGYYSPSDFYLLYQS